MMALPVVRGFEVDGRLNAWLGESQKATASKSDTIQRTHFAGLRGIGYWALAATAATAVLYLAEVITWPVCAAFSLIFLTAGCVAFIKVLAGERAIRETPHDYSNSVVLDYHKEKARSQSLVEVVHDHGWEKIFHYAIVPTEEFEAKYRGLVKDLPFDEIIATYESASAAYRKVKKSMGDAAPAFTIPHPREQANKWAEELQKTDEKSILAFFDRYPDIHKLQKYEAIEPSQQEITEVCKQHLEAHRWDPCKELQDTCEKKNKDLLQKLKVSARDSIDRMIELELQTLSPLIKGIHNKLDAVRNQIWKLLPKDRGNAKKLDHAYQVMKEAFSDILKVPTHAYSEEEGRNKTHTWHQREHGLIYAGQKKLIGELRIFLKELKFEETREVAIKEILTKYKAEFSLAANVAAWKPSR